MKHQGLKCRTCRGRGTVKTRRLCTIVTERDCPDCEGTGRADADEDAAWLPPEFRGTEEELRETET